MAFSIFSNSGFPFLLFNRGLLNNVQEFISFLMLSVVVDCDKFSPDVICVELVTQLVAVGSAIVLFNVNCFTV